MSIFPLFSVDGRIRALTESLSQALPALQEIASLPIPQPLATRIASIQRGVLALVDEARIFETLHQVSQVFSSGLDLKDKLQKVTDLATASVGAEFGTLCYISGDEGREEGGLRALSSTSGVPFTHLSTPGSTASLASAFAGLLPLRAGDITQDPRFARNEPLHCRSSGLQPTRSYLAVPVISRTGELRGGLFFEHPSASVFDETAERLARGIASSTSMAMDNDRLYESAQRQILALTRAGRRKEEFLAVLAHELRNPLAPLCNGLEIVRQLNPKEGTSARVTDMMVRQMGNLVRLIDDLSDLSYVAHGRLELHREPVLLSKIVDTALESTRALIDKHGHELIVDCPEGQLAVDADLQRLAQVVSNLLSNSAKYTPRGGRLTLTVARSGSDAVINVIDNGIGIPSESLGSIFEMFSRGHSPEKSEGGLGIGLALVRRLVHLHGGSVTAHSDGVGTGSRFTVRLPALPRGNGHIETQNPVAASVPVRVIQRRILVADDSADETESLALWLQLAGHEVRTVADGQELVAVAEQFRPEVILMDLSMPCLDGLAASRKIRSTPWGRRIRIVALTGWGRREDRLRSQAAGIDLHWVKPVDPHVISDMLAGRDPKEGLC